MRNPSARPAHRSGSWVVRAAVRFLVLFLVPVVIVATPNVGNAAPQGDWVTSVFSENTGGPPIPGEIKCQVNARWYEATGGGTSIQVGAGSGCYSPAYYNSWEPGATYTLAFEGTDCTGREYTSTWMTGANHDWNSNHMIVGVSMEIPAGPCVPSSVCIAGETDGKRLCGAISLGVPVVPDEVSHAGCASATGDIVIISCSATQVTYGFTEALRGWVNAAPGPPGYYRSVQKYNRAATQAPVWPEPGGYFGWFSAANPMGTAYLNTITESRFDHDRHYRYNETQSTESAPIIGAVRGYLYVARQGATMTDAPPGVTQPPPDGPEPDPDPTAEPAADESDACTFEWSDPTTWASAGICAVVHLLTEIWGTLTGLPAAIVELVDGMLRSLFIPSNDPFQGFTEDAKAAWRNSEMGAWEDATMGGFSGLGSGTASAQTETEAFRVMDEDSGGGSVGIMSPDAGESGGSSACAGPGFSFDGFGFAAGLDQTYYPLDACSGKARELADWSRLFATITICLFGFFRIMESITSSVGVMKQASLAHKFDWSNDHTVIKR